MAQRSRRLRGVVAALLAAASIPAVSAGAEERVRPNDPKFPQQWALENTGQLVNWTQGTPGADINATRAWALTTGSRAVVIALVDKDLDYEAEDLAPNVWENPGGVNGCPAGTHGYDVPTGACDPDRGDRWSTIHGTLMAWVMGAVGNNGVGITGVNWTTSIMGVSASEENGWATSFARGIEWVVEARRAGVNVRVINASWDVGGIPRLREAIARAGEEGILFVTAAGNRGDNVDVVEQYPCSFPLPNLICVAASNQRDELAPRSSYGAKTVHLAAPGYDICTAYNNCSTGVSTSLATAFVSGAAALILAHEPTLSVSELKARILDNVRPSPALAGKVATGGVLDVYCAMTNCRARRSSGSSPTTPTTAPTGTPSGRQTGPETAGSPDTATGGGLPTQVSSRTGRPPTGHPGTPARPSVSPTAPGAAAATAPGAPTHAEPRGEDVALERAPASGRPSGDAVVTYEEEGPGLPAALVPGVAALALLAAWPLSRRRHHPPPVLPRS